MFILRLLIVWNNRFYLDYSDSFFIAAIVPLIYAVWLNISISISVAVFILAPVFVVYEDAHIGFILEHNVV